MNAKIYEVKNEKRRDLCEDIDVFDGKGGKCIISRDVAIEDDN